VNSEVQRDGRILDLIDNEDVAVPLNELPKPEQDQSAKEQEMKWTDLTLQHLHENVPLIVN
uniref:Anaphase-promoting complex subunit 13 n=1 Tax=Colobus angolensis palliatus TaxID=336983 RepID=A0A2K5JSD2_COLAP